VLRLSNSRGSFLRVAPAAGWSNSRCFIAESNAHCSTTEAADTRRQCRMLLSINQISELTGQDRRTVTKQLDGLPFQPGDKNAYLYESTEALPRVYAMDSLEAARAAQARSQASLNAVREEDLRKQRIAIQIVRDVSSLWP
jgi:hypothetical protein